MSLAATIAEKSPAVIRAAKESLNGIDLWDVRKSYRYEQGYTFELNLSGVADERRAAWLVGSAPDPSSGAGAGAGGGAAGAAGPEAEAKTEGGGA
jgi:enoyl-CoA hydratase